ncbi:MAG: uroporphyrinogen decarboxylase family protein [Candidatus Latescibacterota bacterium]
MTPKAVVEATFRFEDNGFVPYRIPICDDVHSRLDAHYGSAHWQDRMTQYFFGEHYVGQGRPEVLGGGLTRSPYGYVTRERLDHLEEPALNAPKMDGYRWPVPENLADWDSLAERYQAAGGAFRLCGMAYGFFERGMKMRGMEHLLMDMIEHPQFVHDLFDGYQKLRLKLIDMIIDRIPVEGIFDGGDDCDQRGPMMGLGRWREFVKPRLKAVIDHVHAKGFPVVAHMCGNVRPLAGDLLEMGLDALESLQPEAMDVYELKRFVQGKMVLIGGMGTQSTLPFGSPEEVRGETRKLIEEMGRGGGYVVGPAKPVMEDVPLENAVAFIETAVSQEQHTARPEDSPD